MSSCWAQNLFNKRPHPDFSLPRNCSSFVTIAPWNEQDIMWPNCVRSSVATRSFTISFIRAGVLVCITAIAAKSSSSSLPECHLMSLDANVTYTSCGLCLNHLSIFSLDTRQLNQRPTRHNAIATSTSQLAHKPVHLKRQKSSERPFLLSGEEHINLAPKSLQPSSSSF